MTEDLEWLLSLVLVILTIACITTTAFPLLYAFTLWYQTRLGRALMLLACSFALALDMTLIFYIWEPTHIELVLWVNAIVFAFIAASSAYLTWKMLKHNVIGPLRNKNKENPNGRTASRV